MNAIGGYRPIHVRITIRERAMGYTEWCSATGGVGHLQIVLSSEINNRINNNFNIHVIFNIIISHCVAQQVR